MSFLAPIAGLVAAALTIPLLVALYFLKLRRREVVVPSTLLWRKSIEDMQVNAPFQRLRRNLLLLLQLLILAALVTAMARPATQAVAERGQRVVILIDHSASMNAGDGSPTRFDEAKAAALRLIDDLGSDAGEAMVISFAAQARIRQQFTRDPARLRQAVQSIEPTDQPARLVPALRLVEPHARAAAEDDTSSLRVYVLSDGRVAAEAADEDLALPGTVLEYMRFGSDDPEVIDNLGFVAFSARRDFDRPERVQVFARLANAGDEPITANVDLRIDGRTHRVQSVTVQAARVDNRERPAGTAARYEPGTAAVQFRFTLGDTALVSVHHDHSDLLAADNAVRLNLAPARRLRVGLVSDGNVFLERALRSVGARRVERISPERFERVWAQSPQRLHRGGWGEDTSDEGFDMLVFDRYQPESVPEVDSLYFGAAPPIEGLALREPQEGGSMRQAVLEWQRDHALLRHVVLDDLVLARPGRLAVPMEGQILATAQAGPVLASVRGAGAQHILAAFDLLETNWPMQVSFPVFLSNVVQALGLGALADEAGLAYRAGEVAAVPGPEEGRTLRFRGPELMEAEVVRGEAVLPRFERVGVYYSETEEIAPPFDRLAVNLLDQVQTNLRPARRLEVGTIEAEGRFGLDRVRREVWPWFAWAALAVLMLEWLVYARRMRV